MKVFVIALAVFGVALFAMSIGAIFGKRCFIKGSCGGLGGMKDADGNPLCEHCSSSAAPSDITGQQQGES